MASDNKREEKIERELEKLRPEYEQKLRDIENMAKPEEPKFLEKLRNSPSLKGGIVTAIISVAVITLFLYLIKPVLIIVLFVLLLAAVLIGLSIAYSKFKTEHDEYKKTVENWDSIIEEKKKQILLDYASYAENMVDYGVRRKTELPKSNPYYKKSVFSDLPKKPTVTCPACGSTNVDEISAVSQAITAAAFGALSGTGPKGAIAYSAFSPHGSSKYKCNKCNHMW